MGLFDGPVVKFAKTFCDFLDQRVVALFEESNSARAANDSWTAMRKAIVGESLDEVSRALKFIAEL